MDDSFNPFKNEPSVSQHQEKRIQTTVQTNIIDNYEPFNNEPAVISTSTNQNTSKQVSLDKLEKMQRDLEDRSRRLAEEEERLGRRENQIDYSGSINNFPPFPRCCPVKPCFYQAIDVEIPTEYRLIVRIAYYTWMAYVVILLINIFGTLSYMIINKVDSDTGSFFGVSILYFVLFTPLSYILWYRPLYKAFKNNSSFNFFMFFIAFVTQIIILIIQMLGIKLLGSCGWMISSTVSNNFGVKVFMLIIATGFTVELAMCIFIIIKVNVYFRNSGGSIQKAKEELGHEAAASSTLRSTATGIITNQYGVNK